MPVIDQYIEVFQKVFAKNSVQARRQAGLLGHNRQIQLENRGSPHGKGAAVHERDCGLPLKSDDYTRINLLQPELIGHPGIYHRAAGPRVEQEIEWPHAVD